MGIRVTTPLSAEGEWTFEEFWVLEPQEVNIPKTIRQARNPSDFFIMDCNIICLPPTFVVTLKI